MLAVGTRLGRYEVLGLIGTGGMGEVYRAYDKQLNREVAIKILPTSYSLDGERLRRFEQEATAAASLNHPNIVDVHDVGANDGAPFLVTELLEGETLRHRLGSGPVSLRKCVDYGVQIARGLAAAHERGIVHRDLKPENIFITADGRIKILDFGLAKLVPSPELRDGATLTVESTPGVVLGTVGYMSPEQVRGKPADHRSDLFSFGAILYEMATGRRAFKGDSAADTMSAILKDDPPELTEIRAQVPPALARIVHHCLEKNPAERFQSARDVAFDLESLSTVSSSTAASAIAARRRRIRALPLMLAALLVVGALLGWLASTSFSSPAARRFQRVTFRRGTIHTARFAPDGKGVIYGAEWAGNARQLFATSADQTDVRPIDLPVNSCLQSVSPGGELALIVNGILLPHGMCRGTLAKAPIGGGVPRELLDDVEAAVWNTDGSSLAVVRAVGGKRQLEFPLGKVLYATAGWISFPRFSPDGKLIAFLDHSVWPDDRGRVKVVDLAGNVKVLSSGWSSVAGLAWSLDGREIWFTGANSGSNRDLYATTLSGRQRLLAAVPGSLRVYDVSPKGQVLLSRDETWNGIMGSLAGDSEEHDYSWFDWSLARDLSPDGKVLLFDEEAEGGGPNYSVFIRRAGTSSPVRLGPGAAHALSPDGKWALADVLGSPAQLTLLPTGAGASQPVNTAGIQDIVVADFFPDGRRLLVCGSEAGHAARCYVQDLAGGSRKPVTPEGVFSFIVTHPISPDGKWIVANDPTGKTVVYPADGGEGHEVPGVAANDLVARWASDSRSLFVYRRREVPLKVYRVDAFTGQRQLWKEFSVSDRTGFSGFSWFQITPDGRYYAYVYGRSMSELYIGNGVK
jgi:eukaryotic-like serine/threonine-protein kinase